MIKKLSLVASLFFIFTGIFLIYSPMTSLVALAWLFALNLIGLGLVELVEYFRSDREYKSLWEVAHGFASLGFGILLLVAPLWQKVFVVPTLLAYWLVLIGLFRLLAGVSMHRHFGWGHHLVWFGGVSILLGLILLGYPLFSAIFLAYLIAFSMLAKGIECFVLFIRLARLSKEA